MSTHVQWKSGATNQSSDKNVAISPHLTQVKRDNELISVVDAHPEIPGIGIDEDAALVVLGNRFEEIGGRLLSTTTSAVMGWLKSGEQFDGKAWARIVP